MFASFITFTCYGTHLLGEETGSVDARNNTFGTPVAASSKKRRQAKESLLEQEPYFLDEVRRIIVRDAIVEVATFRSWILEAAHVRTNHVHVVIRADAPPEKVMLDIKSYASRRMNEANVDAPERKRWTRHGSTRHLWTETAVAEKIRYSLYEQGKPMATYPLRLDANAN